MNAPLLTLAAFAVLSLPLCAEEARPSSPSSGSGGIWSGVKDGWHAVADPTAAAVKSTTQAITGLFKQNPKAKVPLLLDVAYSPNPVTPSKTTHLQVFVKVYNNSKKTQLLEFTTTQRADAVLRDSAGKIVARASEGNTFAPEPTMTTINPGERLEYALSLSTQTLTAGRTYNLEVGLAGQSGLSGSLPVIVR